MVGAKGFSPNHVLQGGVGDCWFLSAIAVLAERPDLLDMIVQNKSLNGSGKYTFTLFLDGYFRDIEVDDFLPCRGNRLDETEGLGGT